MLTVPLFDSVMFDARGSYTPAFLILGGIGSLSSGLFLFAKKPQFGPSYRQAAPGTRPRSAGTSTLSPVPHHGRFPDV